MGRRLLPLPARRDLRRRRDVAPGAASWLEAWRETVDRDPARVHAAIDDPRFVARFSDVHGESLKRTPTGYPPDHPEAALLRLKDVTFGMRLADDEVRSAGPAGDDRDGLRRRRSGVPPPRLDRELSRRRGPHLATGRGPHCSWSDAHHERTTAVRATASGSSRPAASVGAARGPPGAGRAWSDAGVACACPTDRDERTPPGHVARSRSRGARLRPSGVHLA